MNLTAAIGSLSAKACNVTTTTRVTRIDRLRACIVLVKPRIVTLVVFTALVACFAAAHGHPPSRIVLLLVLSGSLTAGGAAALNHYVDRDIDARMARTSARPLVRGVIHHPHRVLFAGVALISTGIALAATVNSALALFELAGAVVYAGIYTLWLKRRSPLNIVIGGAAGSAAVLGGWAAADPNLGPAPWLLAGLVFFWTPAHFWGLALARRADYEQAGVPMLPTLIGPRQSAWWIAIHILATVALSVWAVLASELGPISAAATAVAGLGFLTAGTKLLRRPGPMAGWLVFKVSGPYLGLVFLGILLDTLL